MALKTKIIDGKRYVLVPPAEYKMLTEHFVAPPDGSRDGVAWIRGLVGNDLKALREAAGLSQTALAAKLGKSQAFVSLTESGAIAFGDRYLRLVQEAVGPAAVAKVDGPKTTARKAPAKAGKAPAKKRGKAA